MYHFASICCSYTLNPQAHFYDNGPNTKLNNLYGNTRMNWMRHHETLKFTPTHMNSVPFETWEAFKLSYAQITHIAFKKTPPPLPVRHRHKPPSLPWRYSTVKKSWTYRKGQYCANRDGRSQENLPNGHPEGRKGVNHWGTSSLGNLHMTPRGPGLSYLFIESIHLRGRRRYGGQYISTTLQARIMDEGWTQTLHHLSTWLR